MKQYTVNFTADELAMIEPLVAAEANFYESSDDELDKQQHSVCKSIIEKITAAG